MLKAFLLTVLLCATVTIHSFARIIRVNNNPGINANFKTLDSAYNAANSDDTLYLEGSPTSYGSLTCGKKLTFFGPGYFLTENPNTQRLPYTAILNGLTFINNSQNSVVMGLEFRGNILINTNDISIRRNKFTYPFNNDTKNYPEWTNHVITVSTTSNNVPVTNIMITQNYGPSIQVLSANTGIYIFDNYITLGTSTADFNNCLALNANSSVTVRNNIFRRGKVTASVNSIFTNNIMVSGSFEGAGTLVTNNIWDANQVAATNGNKTGIDMATVFEGYGTDNYWDTQWRLKPNSPARGAGFGSTAQNPIDAGIYSGELPYVVSGLPPIPTIYAFETTPVGSNTIPLTVTVKVKAGG